MKRKSVKPRCLRFESCERRAMLSTVSGIVFDDTNGNRSQDAGELPLAGITVFKDANGDSILNAGESSVVTTDDGAYSFFIPENPANENHYVSAILPPGDSVGRYLNTNTLYERVGIYGGTNVDATVNFGFRFVSYADNFAPVGDETLINQTTAGQQGTVRSGGSGDATSVAADAAGNYVVAWLTPGVGQDQVFARVFNADGTPRTNEILVATAVRGPNGVPQMPQVAMSRDGSRFAVAWNSYNTSTGFAVPLARTYDAASTNVNGAPRGAAVQVGVYKANEAFGVTGIAMDNTGNFAVLLHGSTGKGGSWNGSITKFQRFTREGAMVGKVTLAFDGVLANGRQGIGMDAAGNFVVMCQDLGIFAQRFTAAGVKSGSLITVASDIGQSGSERGASVAMNASGRWVVSWSSDVYSGTPLLATQSFSASGQAIGSRTEISNNYFGSQDDAAGLTIDSDGNVTVAWQAMKDTDGMTEPTVNATEIRVRRVSAAGALSDPFVVNTTTEGTQARPSIASLGTSGFVVQWIGRGSGDDAGIFTQRFTTNPSALDAALALFATEETGTRKRAV